MIRHAVTLRPDYADGHANVGKALLSMGRKEEAQACFENAVTLQPGAAARHWANHGSALLDQGWHDDAVPCYAHALELDPGFAEAHWGLGTARLYRMEFADAWAGYERRFEVRSFRNQHFRAAPTGVTVYDSPRRWRGPAETGVGEMAIWAEQGIGDQVLFSTLIPELTGRGVALVYEVDHFNDLEEVLAILEACDLLITTSNATAHFAGALGKRTWLMYLADRAPFHYWAHGGTHRCPWYPSVEIVTAPHLADWASLIEHVKERLERESARLGPGHDGSASRAGGR
jgi:hypothetical protein